MGLFKPISNCLEGFSLSHLSKQRVQLEKRLSEQWGFSNANICTYWPPQEVPFGSPLLPPQFLSQWSCPTYPSSSEQSAHVCLALAFKEAPLSFLPQKISEHSREGGNV